MSVNESRRDFLKKSSMLVGGAAVLGSVGLVGCSAEPEIVEVEKEIPAHPYTCCEFDLDQVAADAMAGFDVAGCCYGAAYALLNQLKEKVGHPFNAIPVEMFANGGAGYTSGTLCGAAGGAFAVIGLVLPIADSRAMVKELTAWYSTTNLPLTKVEGALDIQTVAGSVNCSASASTWMKAADIAEMGDPLRLARCKGLTADVARKAAELLNIHFGFMAAPVVDQPDEPALKDNEYIGEAEGFGGKVKVKVTMDGDKIANIEVLEHAETAGVSDPAFATIPQAIIDAQSTTVDAVANATVSSKAIMAAVENALAQVK